MAYLTNRMNQSAFSWCSNITQAHQMTNKYDYSQENVPPKQRLSVFLLPNSDASRCKNLQVEYSKKNIIWNIEKPMLIGSNQTYYVGSAFLEPPYFGNIPIGFYKITYHDNYLF